MKTVLNNRQALEVPRNIFDMYDLDDYDDCYNDYESYYNYYMEMGYDENQESLVISQDKDGIKVFQTDSETYYDEVIIDKDYQLDDVMEEGFFKDIDVFIASTAESEILHKYPEYFV